MSQALLADPATKEPRTWRGSETAYSECRLRAVRCENQAWQGRREIAGR
jgi:hypothetical protein